LSEEDDHLLLAFAAFDAFGEFEGDTPPSSPIIGTERRLDRKAALKAAGLSAVASSSIFARFFLCRSSQSLLSWMDVSGSF